MSKFTSVLLLCLMAVLCLSQSTAAQSIIPQELLNLFPTTDIALALSLPGNQSTAFISTFNGNVYAVPLPVPSKLSPPLFTRSGSIWQGLVVNPTQKMAYLMDIKNPTLFSLNLQTMVLTSLCSFVNEGTNTLTALTVDFSVPNPIAYITSATNSAVYAVDTTVAGQMQNIPAAIYSDSVGLQFTAAQVVKSLTGTGSLLYLASAVTSFSANVVLSYLHVNGTNALTVTSVTPLYSSKLWYWPDAITVNPTQTMVYVQDGGYDHGYIPSEPPLQTGFIYAVNISGSYGQPGAAGLGQANVTTILQSQTLFLRGGLQLTADTSTLLFVASTTLQELVLFPSLVTQPLSDTASMCFLIYSQPGNIDYPWSVAYSLQITYGTSEMTSSSGTAVVLLSGTGTRTFTNKFGATTTTAVTLKPFLPTTGPLLYLNSSMSLPLDGSGLTFTLASPIQQPGAGPLALTSQVTVFYSPSGVLTEGGSSLIDTQGTAFLATVPGFSGVSVGAANINALVVNYPQCQAPITFINGLRPPTQPTPSNGALMFSYSYIISDGATYRVQSNLTVTTSSAFASTRDMLGNPFQIIVNITGTRTYNHIPSGFTLISAVTGMATVNVSQADERFYPYAFLYSSPGVYNSNNAPYFDVNGFAFTVSPAVPALGLASGSPVYSTVNVFLNSTISSTVLSEGRIATSPPISTLQRQTYFFV